jgi:phage baseplate assembly protein W
MGSFNFKSSGKLASQPTTAVEQTFLQPIGIKTPLQVSDKDIYAMHYSLADQIHDNLKNLLLTNWGERLGSYYFGANLRELTSEISNLDAFDELAITRIRSAVEKWMPFVSLKDFSSSADNVNNFSTAIVKITITYTVPKISTEIRSLQIVLYAI